MTRPTVEEIIHWLDQQALSAQRNAHRYRVGSDFWKLCIDDMQMHAAASRVLLECQHKDQAHAAEKGKVPQDGIGQHPRGGEGRKAAEAGSGDRPVKGREKQKKEIELCEHCEYCGSPHPDYGRCQCWNDE